MGTQRLIEDGALKFYTQGLGWEVFPIAPREKNPPLVKWKTEASRELEKVLSWWKNNPMANIGLRCGVDSGVVVIDVDPVHTGDDSLYELFSRYDRFPDTVMAITGSGGSHYFFKHPGNGIRIPSRNGQLAVGIDVKADGGYVILPPSIHPNGKRYRWEISSVPSESSLAELPEWLYELIKETPDTDYQHKPKKQVDLPLSDDEAFISGTRNEAMTSLAGSMRRRGMSRESILEALRSENKKRCIPPLGDDELVKISESISQYKPKDVPRMSAVVISNRRSQLEWLFCGAVYDDPALAVKMAGWVDSRCIAIEKLRDFWQKIKDGEDRTEVANNLGILSDLVTWSGKVKGVTEVDDLGHQITRNAYIDNVGNSLSDLSRAVSDADIDRAREIIDALHEDVPSISGDVITVGQAADEIERILDNLEDRTIPTYLPPLDDAIGGLEKESLIIVGARPGAGKTTLAWQIARQVAADKKKVLFMSLEMSAMALWLKAASGICTVRWRDVKRGGASDIDISKLKSSVGKFRIQYDDTLFIYDRPANTDKIWGLVAQHSPDLVVVDHLRLLTDYQGDLKEDKRLGYASQRLKELAKFFKVPVLCLAQLNRSVESRENKRPHMSDLRDSGQIEENADIVLMLYREDYYDENSKTVIQDYYETEVLVRKIRDDVAGQACSLQFSTKEQWFYEKSVLERQIVGIDEEF